MNVKYAFLGVGNMAGAIIRGLIADEVDAHNVALYDVDKSKYTPFEAEGCVVMESASNAVDFADYIVLAVKPQSFPELLSELRDSHANFEKKCVVSIAAGISSEYICEYLGHDVAVIRTMPNAPLMIGKGVTALSPNNNVGDRSFSLICRMFSRVGDIVTLPEDRMNAIISVTSSSPAYVYLFIKSITDAAVAAGLPIEEQRAKELVCRMVIGAAEMMLKSNESPSELIDRVATPGGTTAPAVDVLKKRGMPEMIAEAMAACTKRAEELGNM